MLSAQLLALIVAAATPKVMVLDVQDGGAGPEKCAFLRDTLTAALTGDGLDVLSAQEVRQTLAAESAREAACDNDVSCLSELGVALGVDVVVVSTATRLGDSVAWSVSAMDTRTAQALSRKTLDVTGTRDDTPRVRALAREMRADLGVSSPLSLGMPLLASGAATLVLGGAAALAGTYVVLDARGVGDGGFTADDKAAGEIAQLVGGAVAVVGVAVGVVGVVLLAGE